MMPLTRTERSPSFPSQPPRPYPYRQRQEEQVEEGAEEERPPLPLVLGRRRQPSRHSWMGTDLCFQFEGRRRSTSLQKVDGNEASQRRVLRHACT
jgi:hypothetical protein